MSATEPISVRRYGSHGPIVLVLHGGPGAPGSVAGLARDLGSQFQVLEPIQRRSGPVPLTVAQHVDDLSRLAPERAAVVGWSWGAMLGLSFAWRHPDRVSDLVLIGCGTYDERARGELRQGLEERLGEAGCLRVKALEERLESEGDPDARDLLFDELGRWIGRAEAYDEIDESEPPEGRLPADAAGYLETWRDALRLQREAVEPNAFAAIRARVLMVHGEVDPHPGPSTRDLLRRFVPQLEYLSLERCGHRPWRERHARTRFLEVVPNWLAEPGTRTRTSP